MANEADPGNVQAVITPFPGRLIALAHVGLGGNLEVLRIRFSPRKDPHRVGIGD
jgi:hypothetical protein